MRYLIFIFFLLTFLRGFSQSDSLKYELPVAEILAEKVEMSTRFHFTPIQQKTKAYTKVNDLGDLLQDEHFLFIKSYGLGSLATPGVRGTGASHLAVLWQGFNIQSPMNGTFDLSLIPVQGFGEIVLQNGGASSHFGSGAIGGVLHLSTPLEFGSSFQTGISTQIGAFGQLGLSYSLEFGTDNFVSRVYSFYQKAKNDFSYRNTTRFGDPVQKNENAAYEKFGITQDSRWRINSSNNLTFASWIQSSDRQIPPTMTEDGSVAYQLDRSVRNAVNWENTTGKALISTRLAHQFEEIRYVDSLIGLDALSRAHTLNASLETRIKVSTHMHFSAGWQSDLNWANADNYGSNARLDRHALFAALRFWPKGQEDKDLEFSASIRQAFDSNDLFPLSGEFAYRYSMNKGLLFFGHVSKNFRAPTFNDLFWQGPGARGNFELLPESGWSFEQSLKIEKSVSGFDLESTVSAFSSITQNWILWLPGNLNGAQIWTPRNEQQVWARGIEFKPSLKKTYAIGTFGLRASYQFVRTSLQKGENKGKLLVYSPSQQGGIHFSWRKVKGLKIEYAHIFTGKRFTTADNLDFLPSFNFGKLDIIWKQSLGQVTLNNQITFDNIWNKEFQVIAFRPSIPRFIEWTCRITFKKPKQ